LHACARDAALPYRNRTDDAPMSRAATLTLIVPDIRLDPAEIVGAREDAWPRLARLAGRGSVARPRATVRALRPWQAQLLRALSLDDSAARHASAPLSRLGAEPAPTPRFWMHAEPVHLAAGLDRLTLVPLAGEGATTESERVQLRDALQPHLRSCGLALHEAGEAWFVAAEEPLRVETACPEAAGEDLDDALPRGPDAAVLRRTMTELQMLLHEHPVNIARAGRHLPAVNCLWFWGNGTVETAPAQALPGGFGDDAYLRGLYRLYGASCRPAVGNVDELLAQVPPRASAVCVPRASSIDAIEEQWIAPLSRALALGRFAHVELSLAAWTLSVDRLAMLRFWRRPSPPALWVA
jgi:hypothetical protein